jgi:hypothetical protein
VRPLRSRDQRWLFLTPEPEARLPELAAAMRTGLGEPADLERERDVVDRLVRDGGYEEWLDHLAGLRVLVARYQRAHGDDELVRRALEVLENHHLLALTVPDRNGRAAAERRLVVAEVDRLRTGG